MKWYFLNLLTSLFLFVLVFASTNVSFGNNFENPPAQQDSHVDDLILSKVDPSSQSILNLSISQEQRERLKNYRYKVEETSYEVTLKLCDAYRRLPNIPSSPYHKGPVYTEVESYGQWLNIIGHGLYQPVDAILGIKGDLIDARNLNLLDLEYWFGSAYVYFLVRSNGFLNAAFHCLGDLVIKPGTMDFRSKPINRFAATILVFDYEASLLTEMGVGLTIGKVIGLLGKAAQTMKWWHSFKGFSSRMWNKKLQITQKIFITPGHMTITTAVGSILWLSYIARQQYLTKLEVQKSLTDYFSIRPIKTWKNNANYRFGILVNFVRNFAINEGNLEESCPMFVGGELSLQEHQELNKLFWGDYKLIEYFRSDEIDIKYSLEMDMNGAKDMSKEDLVFYQEIPITYLQMIENFANHLLECSSKLKKN